MSQCCRTLLNCLLKYNELLFYKQPPIICLYEAELYNAILMPVTGNFAVEFLAVRNYHHKNVSGYMSKSVKLERSDFKKAAEKTGDVFYFHIYLHTDFFFISEQSWSSSIPKSKTYFCSVVHIFEVYFRCNFSS